MTATPANFFSRHRSLITALLLMLAAWAMYLPTARYGFVEFDDVRILRDHPELYGGSSLTENLRAICVTGFPREEPLLLRDATWALDSKLFGFGNALGYHLGNVLLHGLVVALLFAFLLTTTRRYGLALGVAAGFLALAVHTEPVAWIMGRKDILSALFMLLALLAQTRRLAAEKFSSRLGWHAVVLGCVAAGLFSKISVLTFPLVLLLHAVLLPHLRGEVPPAAPLPGRRFAREILWALPAFVISGAIYVWYKHTLTQMGIFDRGYTARGAAHLWNLLLVNPPALWVYLRQIFVPGQLSVLYTWPVQQTVYPAWQIAGAFATAAGMLGAGLVFLRRRKDLFFHLAAFGALMIPYLNLIYIGIWVADRYLYFAGFCLLAIAGTVAAELLRRPSRAARFAAVAGIVVFFAANLWQKFSYLPAWRNGETLWQHHIALPAPSVTAFENLAACYYAAAGAQPGSELRALDLQKMEVVLAAGLKEFWRDQSQPPPATVWYLFFLQSLVQEVKGEPLAALGSLGAAAQLNPKSADVQLNLARLHHRLAAAGDAAQRQAHAHDARECFARYLALEFRGRPVPPEVRQEADALAADTAE